MNALNRRRFLAKLTGTAAAAAVVATSAVPSTAVAKGGKPSPEQLPDPWQGMTDNWSGGGSVPDDITAQQTVGRKWRGDAISIPAVYELTYDGEPVATFRDGCWRSTSPLCIDIWRRTQVMPKGYLEPCYPDYAMSHYRYLINDLWTDQEWDACRFVIIDGRLFKLSSSFLWHDETLYRRVRHLTVIAIAAPVESIAYARTIDDPQLWGRLTTPEQPKLKSFRVSITRTSEFCVPYDRVELRTLGTHIIHRVTDETEAIGSLVELLGIDDPSEYDFVAVPLESKIDGPSPAANNYAAARQALNKYPSIKHPLDSDGTYMFDRTDKMFESLRYLNS